METLVPQAERRRFKFSFNQSPAHRQSSGIFRKDKDSSSGERNRHLNLRPGLGLPPPEFERQQDTAIECDVARRLQDLYIASRTSLCIDPYPKFPEACITALAGERRIGRRLGVSKIGYPRRISASDSRKASVDSAP